MAGEKTVTAAPRVLVVEDELNIRELVCLHLGLEGYACEGLGDGQAALKRTEQQPFDLLLLDVMIPGLDGVSLCRAVRNGRTNRDVPIMLLTAKRDETDKVIGLESGADDYLTKPFGVRELVARARALLRRPRRSVAPDHRDEHQPVRIHGVEIDEARRRVRVEGEDVSSRIRSSGCCTCSPRMPASSSAARRCWRRSGAATPSSRSAASTRWSSVCAAASRRIPRSRACC